MIKKLAWDTFKKTGNIDTFIEYKKIKEVEKNIKVDPYEIDKSKGNNNSGKSSFRL